MILKQDRSLGTVRSVMGAGTVGHGAEQGRVVVNEDAVVEHRCVSGRLERAVFLEPGAVNTMS